MLDYVFVSESLDGSIYYQTPEDVSKKEPNRSAYYDIKDDKIKRFTLVGKGHTFTVDLRDGHFEIDGKTLYTKMPPDKCELMLIYYRQVTQDIQTSIDNDKLLTPKIRYYLGWQTNLNGKNYKFELGLD